MPTVTAGSIEMGWDAEKRLATLLFHQETRATGQQATALVDALSGWIGADGKRFALLGDGAGLKGVDAEYRSIWGKFFRAHRESSCIAFFNMGPVIRIAAEMFRIGTGVQMKAFSGEADARAWLRERGIQA